MDITTIILFFLYSWGIGYSLTYFVKKPEKLSEKIIMQIGIGLATIPIILVVMDLLHVPLDWRILLVISVIVPIYGIYKNRKELRLPKIKITKSTIYLAVVVLLFLASFYMYHKGSFVYPWLENGDPWDYAVAVKYIATHKTYDPPQELNDIYKEALAESKTRYISNYLPPYPPGYVALMAILHQTNSSVSWTLKFFTSLIASLGILFFYFFVKEFTKDNNISLLATFMLAAIPAYVSHFIYSQALGATLFIPALYCLEKTRSDQKWWIVAGLCISGVLITQSSSAAVFALLFMPPYFIVRFFSKDSWKAVLLAGILGLLLSLIFWGSMIQKYTWDGTRPTRDKSVFNARRGNPLDFYTLRDFIWAVPASESNMIDNPKGFGPVIFFLAIAGIVYFAYGLRKEIKPWLLITVFWVILNALNVNAERLPIGFNPHRGWSFLAFAVAIVAAYGTVELANTLKKYNIEKIIFYSVIVMGVLYTSAYHKYDVNTAIWPTHYFSSESDIPGYMWLENLPDNTHITSICRSDEKVIGMDMYSTKPWDKEQRDFQGVALNKTLTQIYDFVTKKGYQYVIVDSGCVEAFGINRTNKMLSEFIGSGKFELSYPTQKEQAMSTFIFRIL